MSGPNFPMPAGYVWQYHLIVWMQGYQAAWVNHAVHVFAWYGMEGAYLLALPIVFWSIHRRFGMRLGFVFLASMYANHWLKAVFAVVRPSGVPGIRTMAQASGPGYSLPSGHTQGALTFFGTLTMTLRRARGWAWLGALVLASAIGVSRIYAGLHWPVDVLLGLALGAVFSTLGWLLGKWWTYRNYAYSVRWTIGIGIGLLLLLIHRGTMSAQYAAWMIGAGVGILFEERYIGSELLPEWWRRICTAMIGIAGLIALQWVIKWPLAEVWWVIARAILVGVWCTLGAPYVFIQCGLYQRRSPM